MDIDDLGDNDSNEASEVRTVCGPCGLSSHRIDEICQVCYLPYRFIPFFNPDHPSSQKALDIEAKNRPDKKRKAESNAGIFTERIFSMSFCFRVF